MQASERIIVALDVDSEARALELVAELRGHCGVFKVGLELLNAAGPDILPKLRDAGADKIFYDAKLHDIPNTVAGAMRGIAKMGAWCVTVHASGGAAMLTAAVESAKTTARTAGTAPPKIFAVTLLTSIGPDALQMELRVSDSVAEYVAALAKMAYTSGCAGVVASPQEIAIVRAAVPDRNFLIITPGVRPVGSQTGDQARVLTPAAAIQSGADYLVIGRPIVAAPNPAAAALKIAGEMEEVLGVGR